MRIVIAGDQFGPPGVRPSSAAHNAIGLAGESPVAPSILAASLFRAVSFSLSQIRSKCENETALRPCFRPVDGKRDALQLGRLTTPGQFVAAALGEFRGHHA